VSPGVEVVITNFGDRGFETRLGIGH
jgi:hypothetical protein